MLYSSVAYLVTFKMVLLFATSEAVIGMKKAKHTTRMLFYNLTDIILDFHVKNLEDLSFAAKYLTNDEKVNEYLLEIAQNENICERMLEKIDDYVENFQKLLNETKSKGSRDYIPLIKKLEVLQSKCLSQPERNTQCNKTHTSESWEADIPDEFGFRIGQGKQEVKLLLDGFLQLAFYQKCNDIQSLANFTYSLLDNTNLYNALSAAVPYQSCKLTIMNHIYKYQRNFRKILNVGGDDGVELIPTTEFLNRISQIRKYSSYTSPDPL